MNTPVRAHLDGLQYLRGLGALICVTGHALHSSPSAPHVRMFGVEIFFAISGFVSALALMRMGDGYSRPRRAVRLFAGTLLRLLPLYWIALMLCAWPWLAAWIESADSLRGWYWNFGPRQKEVLLDFLMIPRANQDFEGRWWPQLVPGWTLNLQIWLSAIFALATLAGRHHWLAASVAVSSTVGLASAWPDMPPVLRFYCQPVSLAFVAGILLHEAHLRWPPRIWSAACFMPAALLSGVLFVLAGQTGKSLTLTVVSAWGVWLFLSAPPPEGSFGRLARRIGDASYPIYLFHTALAFPLVHWALQAASPWPSLHDKNWWLPILICQVLAAALVGMVVHVGLERPLLRLMRRRWRSSAQLPELTVVPKTQLVGSQGLRPAAAATPASRASA